MYSIQAFKNDTQGTLVASRGGITGQCVSLVQKWAEVNGVGGSPVFPVANARDMNATTEPMLLPGLKIYRATLTVNRNQGIS